MKVKLCEVKSMEILFFIKIMREYYEVPQRMKPKENMDRSNLLDI